ncbi:MULTISPECIES: helix-turn-helix domain-containing protein [Fusobacterium]|jgi:transposase|uniref:Transposase n=1 Tax=Fusobacterium varium ATCC 27725 TaxID=469618 RepID=A0ABN5JGQ5_FUSVA|nr:MULTISPECIES: transposase [Fusobacterium]AVQ31259.1 transposase [Fusobacterium varium ATCC 27725]EES62579.1 transposase [Fusobacterium varium ATCC 27725]MCF0170051.1 transposase [Fusobacterium varium]MCF2672595.1 transposase [Fusobacterium varium]MCI6032538.1 helix-turn-helix domain-containing protein [Fusobacterium varium]
MCREYSRYDKNLKLSVVKAYLKSNVSAEMLAKEYGVKSDTQILDWVKKYKELGEKAFDRRRSSKNMILKKIKNISNEKNLSIKKENKYLRMENEYLKKLYILQLEEIDIEL